MLPTSPDESYEQAPVKHDFSETFERDKSDCKFVGKGELHYIFKLFVENSVSQYLFVSSLLLLTLRRW